MSSFCDEVRGRRREILRVEVLVRGVDDAQRVDSGLEMKAFCKSLGSLWPDMRGLPRASDERATWGERAASMRCARVRRRMSKVLRSFVTTILDVGGGSQINSTVEWCIQVSDTNISPIITAITS